MSKTYVNIEYIDVAKCIQNLITMQYIVKKFFNIKGKNHRLKWYWLSQLDELLIQTVKA
jgi:hypothetical protein